MGARGTGTEYRTGTGPAPQRAAGGRLASSWNQKKPTAPGPAWVPTTAPRFSTSSISACGRAFATRSVSTSIHSGASAWAIATRRPGTVLGRGREDAARTPRAPSGGRAPCRSGGSTPSSTDRIGLTLSSVPASAWARPIRPPFWRYSSVRDGEDDAVLPLEPLDQRLDLLVGRAARRAGAGSRARGAPTASDAVSVSTTRIRSPPDARPRRARPTGTCPRASPRAAASRSARSRRAPRRRRGSPAASAARSSAAPAPLAAARRSRASRCRRGP